MTSLEYMKRLFDQWVPAGMNQTPEEKTFIEAYRVVVADSTCLLVDTTNYLPIILNPLRCRPADVGRILNMHGIDGRPGALIPAQLRRLAIIGHELRTWRGSHRAHRSTASAITGRPSAVTTWISDRFVLDESTMDFIMLYDEDADESVVYVVGQGTGPTNYNQWELESRLGTLAKVALDQLVVIPCWAITTWRNGINSWISEPVASRAYLVPSGVKDEFEAVEIGPDYSSETLQFVSPPSAMSVTHQYGTFVGTVYLETSGALPGDEIEFWMAASSDATAGTGSGYLMVIRCGNAYGVEFYRVNAGTRVSLGAFTSLSLPDGVDGTYHRVDFVLVKPQTNATKTRVRGFVDHDPTPWYDDNGTFISRPGSSGAFVGLNTAQFTQGTLRVGPVFLQKPVGPT